MYCSYGDVKGINLYPQSDEDLLSLYSLQDWVWSVCIQNLLNDVIICKVAGKKIPSIL